MKRLLPAATSLCVAALVIWSTGTRAQTITLRDVIDRAMAYSSSFRRQFANVVAEELYEQSMRTTFTGNVVGSGFREPVTHRVLKSDVLLVRLGAQDGYAEFRDVFEVDGSPVRDRQERLAQLFLKASPSDIEQLQRILAASSRYNIGSVIRTINTPTIAMMFLEDGYRSRFTFERDTKSSPVSFLGAEKTRLPDTVWVVRYKERPRQTIIRRPNGVGDLPTQGRFWIEPDTGRVLMTELTIEDPIVRTVIDVVYDTDPAFPLLVPRLMRERYDSIHDRTVIEGTATYGRFRRFGVQTNEDLDTPKPK